MSHFSVLVVTNENPLTTEALKEALQPYHEFEGTGEEDKYIVDVDITAEALDEYNGYSKTFHEYIDGTRIEAYDDRFYREPTPEETKAGSWDGSGFCSGHGKVEPFSYTSRDWDDGKGYRAKVHYLPEGWKEVSVKGPDAFGFPEFIESYYDYKIGEKGKFGYCEFDPVSKSYKVIKRTNPNKQWDWWIIGGRYANRLVSKSGLIGDSFQVEHLNLKKMYQDRVDDNFKYVHDILKRCNWPTTDEGYDNLTEALRQEAKAKKLWDELPEPRPRGENYSKWLCEQEGVDELGVTYIKNRHPFDKIDLKGGTIISWVIMCAEPLSFFVAVVDGKWIESGSMGWWGVVSDEAPDWEETKKRILSDLKPEQYVTIVDCHI